jgi:hypothetical protein
MEPYRWFKAFARLRTPLRTCAYPLLEAYRWLRGIARLKESNLLVMTGTGMLGDFGITPLGLHYDIFRWAVIEKLCRCKLLFVSVGGVRTIKSQITPKMESYRAALDEQYVRILEGICSG